MELESLRIIDQLQSGLFPCACTLYVRSLPAVSYRYRAVRAGDYACDGYIGVSMDQQHPPGLLNHNHTLYAFNKAAHIRSNTMASFQTSEHPQTSTPPSGLGRFSIKMSHWPLTEALSLLQLSSSRLERDNFFSLPKASYVLALKGSHLSDRVMVWLNMKLSLQAVISGGEASV